MHPNTPAHVARFAETHRQVGAICCEATWLEYQLEVAISELDGSFDLSPDTQGRFWKELTARMNKLLDEGVVEDPAAESDLRQLIAEVRVAMKERDVVAHSTWLRTLDTAPGCVTGQRYRRHEVLVRDWHPDDLEQVRADLESLRSRLISEPWNAVMPPEKHV